jgi:hypothetical protein
MDIVIGLIGAKGAGKTTAFNAIKSLFDVQEITLAAKLKDVCAKAFNIPRDWFDSHDFKEKDLEDPVFLNRENLTVVWTSYGVKDVTGEFYDKFIRPHVGKILYTPRQVAQYIGTEVLRSYEPDIHCLEAARAVEKQVGVVTDMRFPNEFDFFAKNYVKFYPIYISNVGAEVAAGKDTHASEAHLKDLARRAFKAIPNNSSIREFEDAIKAFVKEIV